MRRAPKKSLAGLRYLKKLYYTTQEMSDAHLPKEPPDAKAAGGDHSLPTTDASWWALVAEKVKNLHYGVVQIVIHDSRIVQVERTERFRLPPENR
jgi:hypothetical protein